ncbi:phage/plasmid primase, P4 family [Deinococcus alpinitundrae]|uniref:phage/plasmid primase, P4 family n=1 Tax=Deinococcus alpinitundrae TaxID=468913 RepID=UPI00137B6782|nr:phage/plasmid primase, P4 family [Deinococcus alpinitundrae]
MNPDTARFLSFFPGQQTFQTFADRKDDPTLARIEYSTDALVGLNERGAGIFLMINEGDGAGRSNDNVTRIRAYFSDFDGAELPSTWPLVPSTIVESSPGKFHTYWLLSESPELNNVEFNRQQEAIAKAVGSRPNDCKGLSRVMRVPGFTHHKNGAVPTRLLCAPGHLYALADIARAFSLPAAPAAPSVAYTAPRSSTGRPSPQKIMEVVLSRADMQEGRNNTAFKLACQVRDNGYPLHEAESVMREFQSIVGSSTDPFTLQEAMHAARSVYRQPARQPWAELTQRDRPGMRVGKSAAVMGEDGKPLPPGKRKDGAPTLVELRDHFLTWCLEQGHIYKFHQVWRSWWQYRAGVYEEVIDEVMLQRLDLVLQAKGLSDLGSARLKDVLDKVAREEHIGALDVDLGPYHLNVTNGLLDLASGTLHEHSPEFFSTIQSAASYRPGVVPYEWLDFLFEAIPDAADRRRLQQFAGLCLTGDTSPQRALLLVGEGGTGKSTFTRILSAVLGSLATGSALENIRDGSFLVGTLVGKRMCVVSELQRNVDWLPFKRITGEDKIAVDVKNKTPYTVKLDTKLIILSNTIPLLGDDATNTSLMRRFLPVAFNVKPATPDPLLEARLTAPDELAGVLNWMIDGLRSLQAGAMQFPGDGLNDLTREIVEESNKVIEFLRESCAPSGEIKSGELYAAYEEWCFKTRHRPVSSTRFPRDLIAAAKHFGKEVKRVRERAGTTFNGIVLASHPYDWEKKEAK